MASKESLIHYRIRWKPRGNQSGAKRGLSAGIGDQLRALVLLRDHPDPRRLDLRTSMRDPFERLWVRDFYLNTAIKVIVLVDASASMGYVGKVHRYHVAEEITAQLAIAAYRAGDAFGVYAANEEIIKSGILPPRINKSAWLWVRQHFAKMTPKGASASGLLDVIPHLPQRRSLVFIISDFRWLEGQYKQILKALSHHDVVPVLLQDPAEMIEMPKRGFATMRDVETGATQFVWMRPSLHASIQAARQAHVDQLDLISRQYGIRPFLVRGHFNPALLNQYFMERNG